MISFGCSDDDENGNDGPAPVTGNVIKSGQITANETWTADKVYQLSGRVVVTSGDPYDRSRNHSESRSRSGSQLLYFDHCTRSQTDGRGTASAPIIFTSVADNIEPGNITSPNLNSSFNGLWGGLLVLGNAPISVSGDVESTQIEGIPPSDINGLYGGNDPNDNSGVMRYISIRHGGTLIGDGNEINGLTLGGVEVEPRSITSRWWPILTTASSGLVEM